MKKIHFARRLNAFPCLLIPLMLMLTSVGYCAGTARPNILFAFADDWGRYAGAYADLDGPGTLNDVIRTPNFDRVAREGVLFRNAFVTAPSCTPCRTSILSGQYFFRTGRAAILQGAVWDPDIPSFPLILKDKGYHIGETYKVWSPGTPNDAPFGGGQFAYDGAGRQFNSFSQTVTRSIESGIPMEMAKSQLLDEVASNFKSFLDDREEGQPFCYWFGPTLVHRKWIKGSGRRLWDIDPDSLKGKMPPFLPDVHEVRQDMADYFGEIQAFDAGLGVILKQLESRGELENTLVVVSGDHGAPGFPRGKCNLYDFGVAVPLAVRWGSAAGGRVMEDFINLMDLAPTFLEAAGAGIPDVMTGRSFLPLLHSRADGWHDRQRNWVITGRERHVARAREGNLPYPQRALRTDQFLYIINFEPDRWPMGDPRSVTDSARPSWNDLENNTFICFGDLDASPTKAWMIANRDNPAVAPIYDLGFGKRPGEELYDLQTDPHQMRNVAMDEAFREVRSRLRTQLLDRLHQLEDPRVTDSGRLFENPPFTDP